MNEQHALEHLARRERECHGEHRAHTRWLRWLSPANWVTGGVGAALSAMSGVAIVGGTRLTELAGWCALIAGVLSALHTGLKCDAHQTECRRIAKLFAGLEAEYQTAQVNFSPEKFDELERKFALAKASKDVSVPAFRGKT